MLLWCIYLYAELVVQTQLVEGFASRQIEFENFTGIRVVFSALQDPSFEKMVLEPLSDFHIIMDVGNQILEEINLKSNTKYTLLPNAGGRVSFFIKMTDITIIDAHYYHENKQQLLHLDMDVIDKLKNVKTDDISKTNPSISSYMASQIAHFIRFILSGSIFTHVNEESHLVQFNNTRTQINPIHKRDSKHLHYRTIEIDPPTRLFKRDNIFAADIASFIGNAKNRTTVALKDAISFIIRFCGRAGVFTKHLVSFIKDFYYWRTAVRPAKDVMHHYSRILKDSIFEAFEYVDMKVFEHYIDQRNDIEISTIDTQLKMFSVFNKTSPPELNHKHKLNPYSPYLDARSSFIEDMFIQNVNNASMGNESVPLNMTDLNDVGMQFINGIKDHVNSTTVGLEELIINAKEVFVNKNSLSMLEKVKLFYVRMIKSMQTVGVVLKSVIVRTLLLCMKTLVAAFWKITHTEINVPILSPFIQWVYGTPSISFLDTFTTMGSAMFTYSFRYYHNKFPLNERDVAILRSVDTPYLLLWTWDNDPIAGPPSLEGNYKKKLMLDWMTKAMTMCSRLFGYSMGRLINMSSDFYTKIRLYIDGSNGKQYPSLDTKESQSLIAKLVEKGWNFNAMTDKQKNVVLQEKRYNDYWKKGPPTARIWLVTNQIFAMNNFLAANLRFPFNNMKENDPAAIRKDMTKPDKGRWMYWLIRYPRIFWYVTRPILEENLGKVDQMYMQLIKFSTNGFMKWFNTPFNIVELYNGIDIADNRRYVTWALTSAYWSLSMLGDVADMIKELFDFEKDRILLRPFGFSKAVKKTISTTADSFNKYTDVFSNLFCFFRYNIYVGYTMSGWYGKILDVDF